MRIINIIVHDSNDGILTMDSFLVVEEQLSNEVVEEAEQHFTEKCVTLKFGEETNTTREDLAERNFYREEVNELLEDGYVNVGNKTISFVWSYPQNV